MQKVRSRVPFSLSIHTTWLLFPAGFGAHHLEKMSVNLHLGEKGIALLPPVGQGGCVG